jgi:hypothetical protein
LQKGLVAWTFHLPKYHYCECVECADVTLSK